jgi:hypothetical protein
MTQADSVHSTPRTNTSLLGGKIRRFLNQPVDVTTVVGLLTICGSTLILHIALWATP